MSAALDDLIETLATGEAASVDVVIALQPLMAPALWSELAETWEVCPVHVCDEQICADDQADCYAGRVTD